MQTLGLGLLALALTGQPPAALPASGASAETRSYERDPDYLEAAARAESATTVMAAIGGLGGMIVTGAVIGAAVSEPSGRGFVSINEGALVSALVVLVGVGVGITGLAVGGSMRQSAEDDMKAIREKHQAHRVRFDLSLGRELTAVQLGLDF